MISLHSQLRFLPLVAIAIVQIGCAQTSPPPADTTAAPAQDSTSEETISTNEAPEVSAPQTASSAPEATTAEVAPAPQPPKAESASGDGDFHGVELGSAVDLSQGYSDTDTGTTGISETVQFAPGTSSATLSAAVTPGTVNKYYLIASGGQVMDVNISSTESNGVFQVYLKYENMWSPFYGAEPGADATEWLGTLPGNALAELLVVVGSARGGATYDLFIGIE
ncbi:hypothetical protein [Vacuolonema iberomarrocanum]|uniref:hypothetical protein n=1 Tax=Vacuolonema iberomarrocanum TaxID=3454632 RepID=UPI001A100B28|nr:hypothetical protein [filamentous cyanobacterium LEGE 07170]